MSTKLILIRHGQTDYNHQKRYCGFSDVELNKIGESQAKELAVYLNNEKIDKVYSSHLRRAVKFAKIAFKDMVVEKIPGISEMNFGIFEGLTYDEIMNKYPRVYNEWLCNLYEVRTPDGENLNDLALRVRRSLKRILKNDNSQTVAVVTHGGPIRIILADSLNLSLSDMWRIEPASASVSIVEFSQDKRSVSLLTDNSYLNG